MHFKTTVTCLSVFVAQLVVGWHIEKGTPEGVYSVQVFDNGTEHHVRIRDFPDVVVPRAAGARYVNGRRYASAEGRSVRHTSKDCLREDQPCPWNLACYFNEGPRYIAPDECDRANAGIDAQCGDGAVVHHHKDFYSIAGCSVAYVCHFGGSKGADDGICTAAERVLTSKLITDRCGLYVPGSATQMRYHDGSRLYYNMTYGYEAYCTSWGHEFCARGTGG